MPLNNPEVIEPSDFESCLALFVSEVNGAPVLTATIQLKPHRAYDTLPHTLYIPGPVEPLQLRVVPAPVVEEDPAFEESGEMPVSSPNAEGASPASDEGAVVPAEEATQSESDPANAGDGSQAHP